jgi:hypothetical protein
MMNEGEAPDGTDVEQLMRDAIRELVGLGPIGMLLEEEDVTEIQCLRHDNLLVTRGGAIGPADTSFTSEDAFSRIIGRLTLQAGEPVRQGEFVIERRLPRGAHMLAFVPPASAGHALLIRKRRRLNMSLEDFVRLGGLSRAMATFLENCMAAKAKRSALISPRSLLRVAPAIASRCCKRSTKSPCRTHTSSRSRSPTPTASAKKRCVPQQKCAPIVSSSHPSPDASVLQRSKRLQTAQKAFWPQRLHHPFAKDSHVWSRSFFLRVQE